MPAPKVGQHTIEILREAGYQDAAINKMIADGIAVDGRLAQNKQ
jgi:crotonobetainyl-CoA:carnitine CoA-transferase CaiB-like acyl-CoA transferase